MKVAEKPRPPPSPLEKESQVSKSKYSILQKIFGGLNSAYVLNCGKTSHNHSTVSKMSRSVGQEKGFHLGHIMWISSFKL